MVTQAEMNLITGVSFIVIGALFKLKSRNNLFNKGDSWAYFAIFHGIDEAFDSLKNYSIFSSVKLWFEKGEIIFFALSAIFLIIGTLIVFDIIPPKHELELGLIFQSPFVLLVLIANETTIDVIETARVSIGGFEFSLIALSFGVIPTIPLIIALLINFLQTRRKFKTIGNTKIIGYVIVSMMLTAYAFSELYASTNNNFLLLEIFAIAVVLLFPVEYNLSGESGVQLFVLYHKSGIPVTSIHFNTSIDRDTVNLVTSFLSAIKTLVENELELGELQDIQTDKGTLVLVQLGEFILATLTSSSPKKIKEKLFQISDTLSLTLKDIRPEIVDSAKIDQIDTMIIKQLELQ